MQFELLDSYLLDGVPSKDEVIAALLTQRAGPAQTRPFYEGFERTGSRTPDLALIALRLVAAGKQADDETVVALRDLVERARRGDAVARTEYAAMLKLPEGAPGGERFGIESALHQRETQP